MSRNYTYDSGPPSDMLLALLCVFVAFVVVGLVALAWKLYLDSMTLHAENGCPHCGGSRLLLGRRHVRCRECGRRVRNATALRQPAVR